MGVRRSRETEQRRSDPRIVSWNSASGGISVLSGSHREANPLRSFASRESHRYPFDGELCHVARCFGQRALFRGPECEVLRSWKDRSRADPRLSGPERITFGRSRALAGSLSELSNCERDYGPVGAIGGWLLAKAVSCPCCTGRTRRAVLRPPDHRQTIARLGPMLLPLATVLGLTGAATSAIRRSRRDRALPARMGYTKKEESVRGD